MNPGTPSAGAGHPQLPSAGQAWKQLHARACAPYLGSGHFAWHFARGKLGWDPVFRGMLERGDLRTPVQPMRVVDIGCGQGLLGSLLQACADVQAQGRWPADWPDAPRAVQYLGIELMARDVARARHALGMLALAPAFVCADMRQAEWPPCDLVVILDALHYIDHDAQATLLARVRRSLGAHGRLITRVGDRGSRRGFALSQWVDRMVTRVRGHRVAPSWGRSVADWTALLQGLGFDVRAVPMSRRTPFANVMLVADVKRDAA